MGDNLNFKNIGDAAVSLFVMHTGNNFYELSNAVAARKTVLFDCIQDPNYEDYANNNY